MRGRWMRGERQEKGGWRSVPEINHQQKVGTEPPAAGEPEHRAGEPGGNEKLKSILT